MAADSPRESPENEKSRKGKKRAEAICRSSVRHSILGASCLLRSDKCSTPVNRQARTFHSACESPSWGGIHPSLTLFQLFERSRSPGQNRRKAGWPPKEE